MAINNTKKEKAAGGSYTTTATTINDLDCPTKKRQGKAFTALRAAFNLKGHALHRTDPADGPVTFWVERWGLVRQLPTIDAVRRFLEQIGGRL